MKTPRKTFFGLVLTLFVTAPSLAQDDPYECDDRFAPCGTPDQSGGGGGGGGGGSVLIANTDLGVTYQNADDYDDDGIEDPYDNCPWVRNPDQIDDDGDGVGTSCDNCPVQTNTDQGNLDGDIWGDLCDLDTDGDGIDDSVDLCRTRPDPLQIDTDGDQQGDACDPDIDGDGVPNLEDNCAMVANPDQSDSVADGWGDACDDDDDSDGIRNTHDNCPYVANFDQADLDQDGSGDLCDADVDGDALVDALDNCPRVPNPDQLDRDRDGAGEACDDRYCYVVFDQAETCLDPEDPFRIHAPDAAAWPGQSARLRLFANHADQAMSYAYTVVDAPRGSRSVVENPIGKTSTSSPFEYHYDDAREARFTPDKPGLYIIRVVATLEGDDMVTGVPQARSEAFLTVVGLEEAKGGGCQTAPAMGWLFLPLGLTLISTRRRQG